jgi:hypothetical protein
VTTGQSLVAKVVRDWLSRLGIRTLSSSLGVQERMGILNHSMGSYGMNC